MDLASKQRFLFDPVTKLVGQLNDAATQVTIVHSGVMDGGVLPIDAFVSRNRDAICVECATIEDLNHATDDLELKATALDYWLMLLDPEIGDATKERIAVDLEQMFEDESIYSQVQSIAYSAPLPPSASVQFIAERVSRPCIRRFSQELLDAQRRVQSLFGIWDSMKSEQLVASKGHRELTGHLVAKSIFRKLATEGKTQADVDRLKGKITFELATVFDARIVSRLLSEYKRDLPAGEHGSSEANVTGSDIGESDEEELAQKRTAPRPIHHLYQQAEKEVAAIASLFAEGKDFQADEFLRQFVARQQSYGGEYVVKSLCNIASRTSTAGRRDVSFRLLQRAMEQSDGLDTILYLQIGREFREIREFEKALECYKCAKLCDDGTKADTIRDEIIRVSVAKGDYDAALALYREIKDLRESPWTLNSLGTLYRKMGKLPLAKECYLSVLDTCQGNNDVAHAGLAEVLRQSGKPHQAISQYQKLLVTYKSQLSHSSERVYRLALSQALRLTQQYSRAEVILKGLQSTYPFDPSVNLQLAKVYYLTGEVGKAYNCAERAKLTDFTDIAMDLFRLVVARSPGFGASQMHMEPRRSVSISDYLPEDRGLVGCRNAVVAISEDEFDAALDSLQGITYVDSIHGDFASVLCFHAKRAKNGFYDYRENREICRVLKRGFSPLRKMAQAIASDQLDSAKQQEMKFCLLVA